MTTRYTIHQLPFLKHASVKSVKRLEEYTHIREWDEGTILYDHNDDASKCYIIFEGEVKQQSYGEDGKYAHVSNHREGEYFGYYPIFENCKRLRRAICSKHSVIGEIDGETFVDIFLDDKALSRGLITDVIACANEQILMRSGKNILSSEELVILDLLRRQRKLSSNYITLPNRTEWAAYLGVSAETLSRSITKIKETGAIQLHGDDIELLDIEKLSTGLPY